MPDIVSTFVELFRGRHDAIGTEAGGCLRLQDVTADTMIARHLQGQAHPIGIYPLVYTAEVGAEWVVRWGCVDFDLGEEESLAHAWNVATVLEVAAGIKGWVERSRSKGYHLWVFAQEWVPAALMRRALIGACETVDAPTKEVNPKQESLKDPSQLGNYVRLPYPGMLGKTPQRDDRRVMLDVAGDPYPVGEFVAEAHFKRATTEQLEQLAISLYIPPPPPPPKLQRPAPSRLEGDAVQRMSPLARKIYDEGPLEGKGRGHTLYKLACLLAEDGRHTPEEALELLYDADTRWGKFVERGDADVRIPAIVEKVFGKEVTC